MNIDFIEGFLETARLKSLAKASEKLRISHPALSKQIKALETYYGVRLFHRSPAGVALTDHGKLFYDRILPVFTELRDIRKNLAEASGIGDYKIGALPSLASRYLPEIVMKIEEEGIGVEVEIHDTSDELDKRLTQGDVQAAIMERQPHHSPHWSLELFDEPYDVAVYAGHRFAGRDSVSIQEIGGEPLILNPPNCTIRKLFSELLAECGVTPTIKAEVPFGGFIFGYVAAGAGITFAPRKTYDKSASHGLVFVPIDDPRAKRTISLVCSTDRVGRKLRHYFLSK